MRAPRPAAVIASRTWPDPTWQIPANDLFNPPIAGEDVRAEIETRGPWQIVYKVRALAVLDAGADRSHFEPYTNQLQIIGVRTLHGAREAGYCMQGRVKANGRSYRAFTSSILCQAPDGKLCSVTVLYCCADRPAAAPAVDPENLAPEVEP